MNSHSAAFAATSLILLFAADLTPARGSPAIVAEGIRVPSVEAGIDIYVRNEHSADMTKFASGRTLLYVHGATYPASETFDLKLGGSSFMDLLANRGFDVYAMDLPGYGKSSRPMQMSQPAEANPPFETTADAVGQYGAVVDYVLKRHGVQKLNVMGWSWGTTIVAGFASEHPDKVERMVLYAPIWLVQGTATATQAKLGAYRSVTVEQARQRWLNGVPEDKKDTLIPPGWFDAWQKAMWATDQVGNSQSPPVIRAPNGVVEDVAAYWRSGKPTYDPARIAVPTLLVGGEWDHDAPPYMRQALFPLMVNAPWRRYVEIGEGTHMIMWEKNRDELFHVVADFLTRSDPTEP